MRRAFVAASRAAFKAMYQLRCARVRERADLAVFLSRQTDAPSYDFAQLAAELEARGWTCVMHLKKVRARNIVTYAAHVVREIGLLARCKLVVLDRYDPVVSLLDFECDALPQADADAWRAAGRRNLDFPARPVVLQMWHAFGAYKKFGFQSVGTAEGHSADFTGAYDIHRNYSWVMCSGTGAQAAFAEAFSCPDERVIALVRPEYDELRALRARRQIARADEGDAPFTVLMAPTLRKSHESAHPFRTLFERRSSFERDLEAHVTWSFHPLEEGLPAPGNVSEQLLEADCLVTDYSSIVYEAWLLGVPALFFVPDLESYRTSPGLNADPARLCPQLCVRDEDELKARIRALAANPKVYPHEELDAFARTGFDPETAQLPGTAASRIADFALACVSGGRGADTRTTDQTLYRVTVFPGQGGKTGVYPLSCLPDLGRQ